MRRRNSCCSWVCAGCGRADGDVRSTLIDRLADRFPALGGGHQRVGRARDKLNRFFAGDFGGPGQPGRHRLAAIQRAEQKVQARLRVVEHCVRMHHAVVEKLRRRRLWRHLLADAVARSQHAPRFALHRARRHDARAQCRPLGRRLRGAGVVQTGDGRTRSGDRHVEDRAAPVSGQRIADLRGTTGIAGGHELASAMMRAVNPCEQRRVAAGLGLQAALLSNPSAIPGPVHHQETHLRQVANQRLHGPRAGVETGSVAAASQHHRSPRLPTGCRFGDANLRPQVFQAGAAHHHLAASGARNRTRSRRARLRQLHHLA